jgi:type I restriction enzyme S subunit
MKYGIPSAGDMMITAVGTLGVSYIVKDTDRFYFQDGNILWFKSKGLCEPRFIKDEYATDYVMNQIRGNANASVVGTYTIMNANRTRVVVPPMKLQREYVEKVEAIDKQKASINESIVQTQKLFDYTMDKYFG